MLSLVSKLKFATVEFLNAVGVQAPLNVVIMCLATVQLNTLLSATFLNVKEGPVSSERARDGPGASLYCRVHDSTLHD